MICTCLNTVTGRTGRPCALSTGCHATTGCHAATGGDARRAERSRRARWGCLLVDWHTGLSPKLLPCRPRGPCSGFLEPSGLSPKLLPCGPCPLRLCLGVCLCDGGSVRVTSFCSTCLLASALLEQVFGLDWGRPFA